MPTTNLTITLTDQETAILVAALTYLHLSLDAQQDYAIHARQLLDRIITELTLQTRPPN